MEDKISAPSDSKHSVTSISHFTAVKTFSYIFLFQLRGYLNSCNTDVFSLEIAHQMDCNAQLQ